LTNINDAPDEQEHPLKNWVKEGWQHFYFCLALHQILPLFPLILEYWFSGHVEAKSAALTAALYSIAIGLSSRNIALLGLGIVMGFLLSAVSGFLSVQPKLAFAETVSYSTIGVIFLLHTIERFNRHVVDGTWFLELY